MEEARKAETPKSADSPPPLPVAPKGTGLRMSRKAKIGLTVGASFLSLVGAVWGVKQFSRPADLATTSPETALAPPAAAPEVDPFNPPSAEPRKLLIGDPVLNSNIVEIPPLPVNINLPPMAAPRTGNSDLVIPPIESPPSRGVQQTSHNDGPKEVAIPKLNAPPSQPKKDAQFDLTIPPIEPPSGGQRDLVIPPIDPVKEQNPRQPAKEKEDPFKKSGQNEPTIKHPKPMGSSADVPLIDIDVPPPKERPLQTPKIDETPANIRPVEERTTEPKRITITMPSPKKDAAPQKKDEPAEKDLLPKMDLPPLEPIKIEPVPMPMPREVPPKEEPKREPAPIQIEIPMGTIEPAPKISPMPQPEPKIDGNTGGRPLPPAAVGRDGTYDEDLHSASPNDNYRTISKRFYEDEGYAPALEAYNRDNPANGRYVRIPPIEVLLKRYPKVTPKAPVRATSGNTPASLSLQSEGTPAPVATREDPVYTVAEGGETLRDVAQKTLGSGEYWRYIYDLNSSLNPAEKLPPGTKLRLPPQARVQ